MNVSDLHIFGEIFINYLSNHIAVF